MKTYLIIEYDYHEEKTFVIMHDLTEIKKKYKIIYEDDGTEWNAKLDTSDWQRHCTMHFDIIKINEHSARLIASVYPEQD